MKKIIGLFLVTLLLIGLVGSASAASTTRYGSRRLTANINVWSIDDNRTYTVALDVAKAFSDWTVTYDTTRITACSYKQTTYASPVSPYGISANVSPQPTNTSTSYSTDFTKVTFTVSGVNATAKLYANATRQNDDSAIWPVETGSTRTATYNNTSTVGSFTKPN